MHNKAKIKMIPLKTGRQIFSWFCIDAIDEPLNKYQVLARHIFQFSFVIIFAVMTVSVNASLFSNYNSVNDVRELFYGFYQFISTLYVVSAVITTFVRGPKLASLFRNLENIYNACEILLF